MTLKVQEPKARTRLPVIKDEPAPVVVTTPEIVDCIKAATHAITQFGALCERLSSGELVEQARVVAESVMKFNAVGNVMAALMTDPESADVRRIDSNITHVKTLVNRLFQEMAMANFHGGGSEKEDIGADLENYEPIYLTYKKCESGACELGSQYSAKSGLWCVRCQTCGVAGPERADPREAGDMWNKHAELVKPNG